VALIDFVDRSRRKRVAADRIAAARLRIDGEQEKIDYSDDEEGRGPGQHQHDRYEQQFLSNTYWDRKALFWIENWRLAKRAHRLGVPIPDVFDDGDLELNEATFSEFRIRVNKEALEHARSWAQVLAPGLALLAALGAIFVTYLGNRRYDIMAQLLNERTERLRAELHSSDQTTAALRNSVAELEGRVRSLSAILPAPTTGPRVEAPQTKAPARKAPAKTPQS
jgi:hypothetical protein